jgi:MinD superfamily P-loop ATPase
MKIAIASGKGGTGKTTLATNLASYLARKRRVVLVDLDVEEPDSGLFIKARLIRKEDKFKLIPEWNVDNCTLCGNCHDVCNFNAIVQLGSIILVFPQLCHGCFACSELCPSSALEMVPRKMGELQYFENDHLVFIESRLDIGQEQATPLISQTNKYIDEHFPVDVIRIYDSPPGTSCPVIEATKGADYVILVTEPTPFGLHDLRLAVETMRKMEKKTGVVINRHDIGNDAVLNYCEKEHIPVLAKIRNDRRIAELYSRGKLIYPEIPEVEQQLEKIGNYIIENPSGG